jgi:hypothetical protein
MIEPSQLPRVFVDFHNSDRQGRVRLNTVGTLQDLNRLGVVLHDGREVLLYSYEVEIEGVAVYSTEEGLWVAKFDSNNFRDLPGAT